MASPQVEDGHVDLANEIIEQFLKLQLSGNQWRILWVIFRQTNGWYKKTDHISVSQFERKTGLKRGHIVRALNDMIQKKIITRNDTKTVTNFGTHKRNYQKERRAYPFLSKFFTKPTLNIKAG